MRTGSFAGKERRTEIGKGDVQREIFEAREERGGHKRKSEREKDREREREREREKKDFSQHKNAP